MEKWRTTERVEEIRREITELQKANRIYKLRVAHPKEETAKHEQRQRRLQEIMAEIDVLSGVPPVELAEVDCCQDLRCVRR